MSKFDSIKYINEINDVDELRKEFKDLWEEYYELNIAFVNLDIEHSEFKEVLLHYADKSKWKSEYDYNLGCSVCEMTFDEGIPARRVLGIELEEN